MERLTPALLVPFEDMLGIWHGVSKFSTKHVNLHAFVRKDCAISNSSITTKSPCVRGWIYSWKLDSRKRSGEREPGKLASLRYILLSSDTLFLSQTFGMCMSIIG